jgi:hypothetical protein
MKNDPHVTKRRAFPHRRRHLLTNMTLHPKSEKGFNTFQESSRDFCKR